MKGITIATWPAAPSRYRDRVDRRPTRPTAGSQRKEIGLTEVLQLGDLVAATEHRCMVMSRLISRLPASDELSRLG
jgi:hypothetical protein